jgi:cytochrome c-type biogenesis protein CcmH
MFVLFALLLAVAALGFVLSPLFLGAPDGPSTAPDEAFYRAQLDEVGREASRGDLTPAEAESARAEAARRLLRFSQPPEALSPTAAAPWRRLGLAACLAAVLLGTAVYLHEGAPASPDLPLAEREDFKDGVAVAEAIKRIEQHLQQSPNDARGWEVLGPAYMQAQRYDDAAKAYRQALRLKGPDVHLSERLGEALISAAQGQVTPEVTAVFQTVLQTDPANAEARFYLALGAEQAGDKEKALALYTAILNDSPKDAPWLRNVRQKIGMLQAAPASVADADPQAQAQMIEGMVKGLAVRLQANGGSTDEWLRLIRAYVVLHRPDDAVKALADARKANSGNTEALAALDALGRDLKIVQ